MKDNKITQEELAEIDIQTFIELNGSLKLKVQSIIEL